MARYVPDIKTQRWVVISPSRSDRPLEVGMDAKKEVKGCAFCDGNESLTPPEITRVGGGEKDKRGWKIRVVPNLFPITDIHEVIIHTPDHNKSIEMLEPKHIEDIIRVYRDRFNVHREDGHVMIFCNFGLEAGASLVHPHSQIVVIPRQINLDALSREPVENMIEESDTFISYCPDFSQWPYEIWISPKNDEGMFGDINDGEVWGLTSMLSASLKRLRAIYGAASVKMIRKDKPFCYNYYIHHDKNWFLRIIPRLVHRAGFELGTGLSVNIVDPENAAEELGKMSKMGIQEGEYIRS